MPAETHVEQTPLGPDEVLEDELGERTVGFSVDDEDLAELRTVGEATDYVVARLGGGNTA